MAKLIVTFIVLFALVIIVGGIGSCLNGVMPNYSEGVRTGELYKVSYKGIKWKSYEAELQLSTFYLKGSNSAPIANNVWNVSTTDPVIGKQLEALAGHMVKITYHQWYFKPYRINSEYEVTKVEAIPKE